MKLTGSRIAPALLVAASLGVAACGGSSGGGGGGGGLGKAELVKKTNTICNGHFQTIAAAASKVLAGGQLPKPQQFGQLAQQTIVPEVTAQIKELRALKPSGDVAPGFKKWLGESEAARAKMAKDPSVITNPSTFQAVNGQADSLGLSKDCHIGPNLG